MKRVLFVCVHNAGRSVMAEAFFNHLAAGQSKALSAGTEPSGGLHREVAEAMREVGLDVSAHTGVLLTDEMIRSADHVITMGCAVDSDACPAIRYAGVQDWGLPDPKGASPERVREIRDEIRARVAQLVSEILAPP